MEVRRQNSKEQLIVFVLSCQLRLTIETVELTKNRGIYRITGLEVWICTEYIELV